MQKVSSIVSSGNCEL